MKHNIIKAIVALFALSLFSCQAYDVVTTGEDAKDFAGIYYVQDNSLFSIEGLYVLSTQKEDSSAPKDKEDLYRVLTIPSSYTLQVVENNGLLEIFSTNIDTEGKDDLEKGEIRLSNPSNLNIQIRMEEMSLVKNGATEKVYRYENTYCVVEFSLNPLDKSHSSIYVYYKAEIDLKSKIGLSYSIYFYGKTNTAPHQVNTSFSLPNGESFNYDFIENPCDEMDFTPEHIVFQTSVEIPEVEPEYGYMQNGVLAWLEFDNSTKTLYINTEADEFIANENCYDMFAYYDDEYLYYVKTIDFGKHFNTTAVRNMSGMFYNNYSLESLDLSMFNTANVGIRKGEEELDHGSSDFSYMFANCEKLKSLDLSNFSTSNAEDFSNMFDGCTSLEDVNVSSFDTFNAIYMDEMFDSCESLISLNISNFDTRHVEDMEDMFEDCEKIQTLTLGKNFYLPEDLEDAEGMFTGFGAKSYEVTINYSHYDIKPIICKLFPLMAESKFTWTQIPAK